MCLNALSYCAAGFYSDGYNCYLEGGVLFGVIYGGVIFPPFNAVYFPPPIVRVVVFGPVFAQSVFIVDRRPFFCNDIFYNDAGVRIYNPREFPELWMLMCLQNTACFTMRCRPLKCPRVVFVWALLLGPVPPELQAALLSVPALIPRIHYGNVIAVLIHNLLKSSAL